MSNAPERIHRGMRGDEVVDAVEQSAYVRADIADAYQQENAHLAAKALECPLGWRIERLAFYKNTLCKPLYVCDLVRIEGGAAAGLVCSMAHETPIEAFKAACNLTSAQQEQQS